MSITIHHGVTSNQTPSLQIQGVLGGIFGNANPNPGFSTYSTNNNEMIITSTDPQTNMPNNPPIVAGSVYNWQDAATIEITSVLGNGATAWSGSPLDPNYTFVYSIQKGFGDFCNQWNLSAFNAKGISDLSVQFGSFASGGACAFSPPSGTYSPFFTMSAQVTENATGRAGSLSFPAIRFFNDTFAI
tara:strand:+ start:568 stop:1128 length:561 start_codon:yes stop_codon:yes gene_type:complete